MSVFSIVALLPAHVFASGVSLSGGQKARVALARAVYAVRQTAYILLCPFLRISSEQNMFSSMIRSAQ